MSGQGGDVAHAVRLSPLAIDDLIALGRWVALEADREAADAYLDRVEAAIGKLARYPGRGSPRDDLAPGLRTLSFERRLVVACRINEGEAALDVLRAIDGARDLVRLMG